MDKEIEKKLKIISDKTQTSLEEVTKAYSDAFTELKEPKAALRKIAIEYKKVLMSPSKKFAGVILGKTDIRDWLESRKRKALQKFREDSVEAIKQGYTDENGKPLDNEPKTKKGDVNRNYGKAFPKEALIRTVYGVATLKDSKTKPTFFG